MLTTENLSVFSKDEIVNIALQHVGVSCNIRAHPATLVDFVLGFDAESPLIHDLQKAVVNKERAKEQSKNERLDAFTDYCAQGQTIPFVIIDIGKVPTGGTLNLFNLYVALSRSKGRDTIRLLWNFDEAMFLKAHTLALTEEDRRLADLDQKTKQWYEALPPSV